MAATTSLLTAAELIALLETPNQDGSASGIDPTDAAAISGTSSHYVEVVTDAETPVADALSGTHQPTILDLQADGSTVDFSSLTSVKTIVQDDATGVGTVYENGVAGTTYKVYDGDLAGVSSNVNEPFITDINSGSGSYDVLGGSTNGNAVTSATTFTGNLTVQLGDGQGDYIDADGNGGTVHSTLGNGAGDVTIIGNAEGNSTVAIGDGNNDILTDYSLTGVMHATVGSGNADAVNLEGNAASFVTLEDVGTNSSGDTVTQNGIGNLTLITGAASGDVLNVSSFDTAAVNVTFGSGAGDMVNDEGTGNLNVTFNDVATNVPEDILDVDLSGSADPGKITASFGDAANDTIQVGSEFSGANIPNPSGPVNVTFGDGGYADLLADTNGNVTATYGDGVHDVLTAQFGSTNIISATFGSGTNDSLNQYGNGNVDVTFNDVVTPPPNGPILLMTGDNVTDNGNGTLKATFGDSNYDSVHENGDGDVTAVFGNGSNDVVYDSGSGNLTVTFGAGTGDAVNESGSGHLTVTFTGSGDILNDTGSGALTVDANGQIIDAYTESSVTTNGVSDYIQMGANNDGLPVINGQIASGGTGEDVIIYGGNGVNDIIKGSTGGGDQLYAGTGDGQTVIAEGAGDTLVGGVASNINGGVGDILESAFANTVFYDSNGANVTMKETAAVTGDIFNMYQGASDTVIATNGNATINVGNISMNGTIKGAATDILTFQDSFADAAISTSGGVTTVTFADTNTTVHVTGITSATFTDGVHAI
jgi:hypothetical protein